MIVEIEIQEDEVLMPFVIKKVNEPLAIECYASRMPVEYVLDEDGKPTEVEVFTPAERAHKVIAGQHNRQMAKYQRKQAANGAAIINDIVS